jgi:hypothetical protein
MDPEQAVADALQVTAAADVPGGCESVGRRAGRPLVERLPPPLESPAALRHGAVSQ